jgi:hypothetical protein
LFKGDTLKQARKLKYKRQKKTRKKMDNLETIFFAKYRGKYQQPGQEPGPRANREDHQD